MDHANANLMELSSGSMKTKIIESKFASQEKEKTQHNGQKAMQNKDKREHLAYYKSIAAEIKEYKEVLLFGPTDAKYKLLNFLKTDHHFDKIDIEIRQADKMTENQQYAFIKEYFFNHLSKVK